MKTKNGSTNTAPKLLTPAEVAAELGIDARKVRRLIRRGRLAATTRDDAGARWLVDAAAVRALARELAQ